MGMVGGGQADRIMVFGHEGARFEPSHHRSTSLFGSPLLAVAPCLEIMHPVSSLIKEVKVKDTILSNKDSDSDSKANKASL